MSSKFGSLVTGCVAGKRKRNYIAVNRLFLYLLPVYIRCISKKQQAWEIHRNDEQLSAREDALIQSEYLPVELSLIWA